MRQKSPVRTADKAMPSKKIGKLSKNSQNVRDKTQQKRSNKVKE